MRQQKRIDGRIFLLYTWHKSKNEANIIADYYRAREYKVRVLHVYSAFHKSMMYAVYYRPKVI